MLVSEVALGESKDVSVSFLFPLWSGVFVDISRTPSFLSWLPTWWPLLPASIVATESKVREKADLSSKMMNMLSTTQDSKDLRFV